LSFESCENVAKTAASATVDFLSEFTNDAPHAALINPYNSAIQISKAIAKDVFHTDLKIHTTDILKPTEDATGAREAGKVVGTMAGTVFDYMLEMKALKEIPLFKSEPAAEKLVASEAKLSGKRLALAGTAGFIQGAILTPTQGNESDWHRLARGGATSLSFLTMEALPYAPALKGMDKSFKTDLLKSTLVGGFGGALPVQAEAMFANAHPATLTDTLYGALGGAIGGAAFRGAFGARSGYEKTPVIQPKILNGRLDIKASLDEDSGLAKDMNTGHIHHPDGTDTRVVVKSLDTNEDPWALQRVQHAKIVSNLYVTEGYTGTPPEIAIRTEQFGGKVQDVSVQTHAGKSFGGQVREWTAQAKGTDTSKVSTVELGRQISGKDIAEFIGAHPTLNQATAEGIARKLADGGLDLNLSNWTIPETIAGTANPDGPVHLYDIDPKRGFGMNTVPTFGQEVKYGDTPDVMKLYEGKKLSDISPALQKQFDGLVARYEAPGGLALMESNGLTHAEAEARLARLQYLSKNGFPPFLGMGLPPEAPVIYMTPEYDAEAEILNPQLLEKARSLTVEGVKALTNH
jgi:hypothetical protein